MKVDLHIYIVILLFVKVFQYIFLSGRVEGELQKSAGNPSYHPVQMISFTSVLLKSTAIKNRKL